MMMMLRHRLRLWHDKLTLNWLDQIESVVMHYKQSNKKPPAEKILQAGFMKFLFALKNKCEPPTEKDKESIHGTFKIDHERLIDHERSFLFRIVQNGPKYISAVVELSSRVFLEKKEKKKDASRRALYLHDGQKFLVLIYPQSFIHHHHIIILSSSLHSPTTYTQRMCFYARTQPQLSLSC